MNNNLTFTNTNCVKPELVDLDKITAMFVGWQNEFIASFRGIRVKVDESLEGNQYYIAVSRDIFKQMEHNSIAKNP